MEYSNIGFWNIQIGAWAVLKSLYEPGGALWGPRNLKNDTWADFKSLYEPGGALRGPRNLKNGTWADLKSLYKPGAQEFEKWDFAG